MTLHAIEVTTDQFIDEFNTLVGETEELLKFVANAGGEGTKALRTSVEKNLAIAKYRLVNLQQAATKKTQAAVQRTDAYVHEYPWEAIGIAAGLSVIVGAVASLMMNRHCSSGR
jgi:ElaB/YqjD/DUF883 family membrane-anchored ribosome-binding protein